MNTLKGRSGDIWLISSIVVIAVTSLIIIKFSSISEDYFVEVTYNGDIVDYFELTDELDLTIEYKYLGYNKVRIQDEYVDVVEADCPDKVDVLQAPINKDSWNKSIICAPNRLVIRIVGGETQVDGIV